FAAGVGVWARRLVPASLNRKKVAALFLLVLPLAVHSMYIGQANLVMLGVVFLGLAAAGNERWNQSAAWIALATLIKGYPLALALLLAGLYPARFALRFLAALAMGLFLPILTHWPNVVAAQYGRWFDHLCDSTAIMRERLRSLDHLFVLAGRPLSARLFM